MKKFPLLSSAAVVFLGVVLVAVGLRNRESESNLPKIPDSERWLVVQGSVHDGDTLRVGRDGEQLRIRLCGIDAPELSQPMGEQSRDYLRSLLPTEQEVIVLRVEEDRYGRTVAELIVENPDGTETHVNGDMVLNGMAYVYPQYVERCPNALPIESAQDIAQEKRVGVWALPNGGDRPWDYRRASQQ
ncbi:thermonuclease family protein [Oscillatoria laete-virens NRMC-F 0139]|nr:thermonuclease family protein [Oscillatoria laete-virens]MDL5055410.1 thermonuclease family protein [Oscillatoria laete-virens NRMC-F 0139]